MAVGFGIGCRHCWDLVLLWLWCRPAAAALILPLAWEVLCTMGVDLKRKKNITLAFVGRLKGKQEGQVGGYWGFGVGWSGDDGGEVLNLL